MNPPTEYDYIEKCKHLIECRLEWAPSTEWKSRDYEYLSELISEKTKISISISTVKRIWKNDPLRIPHVSTLNAFAQFLDYEQWNDFKTKLKNEIRPSVVLENKTDRKNTARYIPIMAGVFTTIIIVFMLFFFNNHEKGEKSALLVNTKDVLFTSKKTVTFGLPNTVVFNYDISKESFDSAFIQQDWDPGKRKRIAKEDRYHTCIYYYPGYYTARLVLNNQEVKKFPLFITTNGWMAVYKKDYNQEIPVYLKNIDLIRDKKLHVSVEDLKTNKIENDKNFLIGFYNARNFGEVYCDSFSFETVVKNDPKEGGLTCQYVAITVEGETGVMTSTFSEKGCTSKLFLEFGNVYVDGAKSDLSAFGTDLTNWRKLKYRVVNKTVELFIDDKKIHQLKYDRNMGKIIGISYHFYGCGSVKEVRLFDKKDKLVYEDRFQ